MPGYVRHHRYKELFKYPGSQVWWMFLPNPSGGRHLRESTGQRDDIAAHREYLRRIRRDPVDRDERSLYEALKSRLDWLRTNRQTEDPTRKKLAQSTIEFYKKKSGTLVRVLGADTLLSEITPERIRHYIADRTNEGAKGTSIAKELTTLSMAMKMARKDGVNCELVRDLKPEDFKTTYVPKERWLPRDEYDRFSTWWYANRTAARGAVLDFLVATGSTYPSEVMHSRRSEIDLKTFQVRIRGTKREKRDRTFVIPSDRRHYLKRAMKHADGIGDALFQPWTNIRRDIGLACAYLSMCHDCERAKRVCWLDGVPARDPDCKKCQKLPVFELFCPTDLRRTFVKWLVLAGVPYELAYPIMGHEDDRMLKKVYGKRSATDVAPLIEAVLSQPRLNPGSTSRRHTG